MKRFLPLPLRNLASDDRGASLIEFGFIAPVLALLAGGIIDLSQGIAAQFQLQQAVNRSLEMIQAKPAEAAANQATIDYTFVKTEAAAAAGVPATAVTITKWLQCTDASGNVTKPASFSAACPSTSETSRYLKVQIQKSYTGRFYLATVQMTASGAMRIQ